MGHILSSSVVTTPMVTGMTMQQSQDHEKLGTLAICLPLAILLGVAWSCLHARKEVIQSEGVMYLAVVTITFAATSISMNTLNKACVSLTGAPSTLTTIQMAITLVATLALHWREVLGADRKKMLRWMIVPIFYAGMLNSSLFGYKYLSLGLVTVFRNLAPLVTMTFEGFIMKAQDAPKVTMPVVLSLLMMVAGALLYSNGQDHSTWLGLGILFLNTLLAITDRCIQRRLLMEECKDLPLSACMTLNNALGMLPTFTAAMAMHEVQGFESHHANWTDPWTLVLIGLSGLMGLGIGFSGLMCQKAMTATSFQVVQNISKVGLVMVGVFVFGDRLDTPARVVGMALSLLGSVAYGLARASETKDNSAGERESLLAPPAKAARHSWALFKPRRLDADDAASAQVA